jgi:hypothetical protein
MRPAMLERENDCAGENQQYVVCQIILITNIRLDRPDEVNF